MDTSAHPWDDDRIRAFRRRLLAFFDEERRELPWRATEDPYRILVSEIMLQQTRVDAVVPYYRRWMERFPDAESLAAAEVEEVLGLWQGLGYYSRARNLHRAVREIVREEGGEVPRDAGALRRLPGVGPYTAGAVASIAFGEPVPAVDGNVRRVLARLMDAASPSEAEASRWAAGLVDPARPGDFNQALMELGALVCTPRAPACGRCPVAGFCAARSAGTVAERPAPRARRQAPRALEAVAVILAAGGASGPEVLLRKRDGVGLLASMWECPGVRVTRAAQAGRAARGLAASLGGADARKPGRALDRVDHAFSHLRVGYLPFLFELERNVGSGGPTAELADAGRRWVPLAALTGAAGVRPVPLPAAQLRILRAAEGAARETSR